MAKVICGHCGREISEEEVREYQTCVADPDDVPDVCAECAGAGFSEV